MIQVGDALPDVTLMEYSEVEGNGCSIGPNPVKVRDAAKGMGLRSARYSMLVKDGKVATLNVEAPGKFEVSDAGTMLSQAKG